MPHITRVALILLSLLSASRAASQAPLITADHADCVIFCDRADPLSLRTANKLADYLAEQTGAKPPVADAADLKTDDPHQTLILIDGSPDQKLLSKVAVKPDVPADRADAYALRVVHTPDHWIIAAAGHTPAGAKYATYRFMEEMNIAGHDASVAPLDVHVSPFFPTRSISLFNIWRVPVPVIRQCNLESWPVEKIQRNVDTYDAFGFNAVETHDRFHEDFLKAVYGITRAQWRDKVYALCDRAHDDGMTVFFRLWGNAVALPVKEIKGGYTPFGFVNLTPDIPEERKRWETEIRDYASTNYASHIDYLIGHWADASGVHPGSNATVKDAILLHNELVAAFRAINPKIQSAFNLWGMANPRGIRGWPGYVDHHTIADSPLLPKDVAVAQTTRSHSHPYAADVTADILAAGRPAAVWTWRRADTEVRFGDAGIRIRVHDLIGDYFHALPDSARNLQWHNIERNHHGLANDVNFYVAGKLMWDPKADVDALMTRYSQLVFGHANAPAIVEAFNVIEISRDTEKFVSPAVLAHPADAARRAKAALDALNQIRLPANFHSRLPSVSTAQELLDQLRGTLSAIADNAQFIANDLPALDALIKSNKTTEAAALTAQLKSKADAWCQTIEGGVEGYWLKQTLKEKLPSAAAASDDTPVADKSSSDFITHNATLQSTDDGQTFTLTSPRRGKSPGLALLQAKPTPLAGPVEFHFRLKSNAAETSHNGGFAFGPSDSPADLIRCQAFLGGKYLQIAGAGLPLIHKDVTDLDPAAEHQCAVRLDPTTHTLTFTVDNASTQTTLKPDTPPVKFYGYTVEKTATQFSPIEVNPTP